MMVIYKITNRVNGKMYIGQTIKPKLFIRWREHIYVSGNRRQRAWTDAIHCAIRKYGADSFAIEPLHHAKTRKELNAMETFFIILHQSHKPENGYNMTLGGEGVVAPKSMQHRERISQALLGIKRSKAHCERISKTNSQRRGRVFSEETIEKMKASMALGHAVLLDRRQAEMRKRQARARGRERRIQRFQH